MANQKLSALSVAVLTDAAEMYLNASGSRKATLENLRNFFLGAAVREAVVAATTANGALATAYANGQVVDGVTLVTGDRILLKDQTAGAENGPYTVNATGAPTRATDFDVSAEAIRGASFLVVDGTTNANSIWMHTTTGAVTLDTTSLVFTQVSGGGGGGSTTWLGLTDTPGSFSGQAAKQVVVNSGESALEFVDAGSGSGVGVPFSGALVTFAADLTAQNFTTAAAIGFDVEDYDAGAWHDNVTNNSRLTVPAGVSKIRVTGQVALTLTTSAEHHVIHLRKNGGNDYPGSPQIAIEITDTFEQGNLVSPVMDVVAGDFFELFLQVAGDTSITIVDTRTWFAIEAVEAVAPATTPRGALVKLSTDLTAQNTFVGLIVPFDAEDYDTDTVHDNVTNNSRLTVPTGVTHVRLSAQIGLALATSGEYMQLQLVQNGAGMSPLQFARSELTHANPIMGYQSPILEVTGGDYFEIKLTTEVDTSVTIQADRCWFNMEIVEPAVVAGGAGKQTLWVPAGSMSPTVSNGCAAVVSTETVAGQPDQHVLGFDTAADEHAQFEIAFPKSWNLGTVSFQPFYTHQGGQTAGLDGVAWGLQGVSIANDEVFAVAYGTAVVVVVDQSNTDRLFVGAESAAITIAGTPAADEMQVFRVFRDVSDAGDDLDIDAQLVGIKLFFTTDKATDD